MSAQTKYNENYHRDGEKFNSQPRIDWEPITEQDRQEKQDALDALIKKTRQSLEN